MSDLWNLLFLSKGNSARSILAESLMDYHGNGFFKDCSTGSYPKGDIHPMAMDLLAEQGLGTDRLRSKPWSEFAAAAAPVMNFVFTVCDQAAGETCPVWPGQPITAHWGVEDSAAVEDSEVERMLAFRSAFRALEPCVRLFTSLPLASIDRTVLTRRVRDIGRRRRDSEEKAS